MTEPPCVSEISVVELRVVVPKSMPSGAPMRLSTCRSMDATSSFKRPSFLDKVERAGHFQFAEQLVSLEKAL